MPLQLPDDMGLGQTEAYEIHTAWETMEKVEASMAANGLGTPAEHPPFPLREVTTTLVADDSQEYLKINAQYLAWLNYILPNLAYTKGCLLEYQNEKTHIEASYREQQRAREQGMPKASRMSREELQDRITLDPRYQELTRAEQEATQKKLLLDAKVEILERTLRVISRHVEVKKIDMEINRVAPNIPARHATLGPRSYG